MSETRVQKKQQHFPAHPFRMWLSIFAACIGLAVPYLFVVWTVMDMVVTPVYRVVAFFLSVIILSNLLAKIVMHLFSRYDQTI
jgi:hypothetical protein